MTNTAKAMARAIGLYIIFGVAKNTTVSGRDCKRDAGSLVTSTMVIMYGRSLSVKKSLYIGKSLVEQIS